MTLIKSMLNSIPIYALSVRLLPVRVQNTLHSLLSKFLWGGLDIRRKLHLVDWDSVSMPIDRKGLEIARLEDLNAALILKWIYKFANESDTLWRRVVCAKSGDDPSCLLSIVTKSGRKSSLFNLIGSMLE